MRRCAIRIAQIHSGKSPAKNAPSNHPGNFTPPRLARLTATLSAQPNAAAAARGRERTLITRLFLIHRRRKCAAFLPNPIAIAPRPPPGIFPDRLRRGIVAVAAPGMAAAEPCCRHPASSPGAMRLDCVARIGRASRQIAAIAPDQGRERPFVKLDEAQEAQRRPTMGWQARRHLFDWVWLDEMTGTQERPLRRAPSRAAGVNK